MKRRKKQRLRNLDGFLREYTAGFNTRDLRRLFDRDAAQAYSVLTRDHAQLPQPAGILKKLLFRARLAFLGLSYKLPPARRLLFAFSLVAVVLAVLQTKVEMITSRHHLSIDFSPFWFLVSIASLIFLLALELVDRVRVRDELEVARELQAELLPRQVAPVPGYQFAHSYRTANEVGGDYYDITPLPDGRVALMVGDASGHGMAAGLVMAIANATLKTALDLDPQPARVLALLNRTLCRTRGKRTFMSVFYALLDPATGEIQSICAGHPYPLLRRSGGQIEELGSGSFPLGIRDSLAIPTQTIQLEPGDLLVLFTDGLAEAVNRPGANGTAAAAFGFDQIAALTRPGGTPQEVHDRILRAFDRHVGDEPLHDDLTLMVVARQSGVRS